MCRCKDRIRGKDENESVCTHCSCEKTISTSVDDFIDIAYQAERNMSVEPARFKGTHIL